MIENFEIMFKRNKDKFKKVFLTDDEVEYIKSIVNVVVPAKVGEFHHIIDGKNEDKRFTTGFYGEKAVEKLLGMDFIKYGTGHSNLYSVADIEQLNIGVKTVEFGKYPIIFKKVKYPEIICIKLNEHCVCVCGLATVDVLNKYQSDDLILSSDLKARGTKTGFYGFDHLLQFSSLEELKNYLKQGENNVAKIR